MPKISTEMYEVKKKNMSKTSLMFKITLIKKENMSR